MIVITSPAQLLLDGDDLGAVFDAVANHKLNMSDVQRAFIAYVDGLNVAAQVALADSQKIAADALARVSELEIYAPEHDAKVLAGLAAQKAAIEAQIAELTGAAVAEAVVAAPIVNLK